MGSGEIQVKNASTDKAIGLALRDLRSKSELSARQLAEASGVSAAMVSRIENGQVSPSISTLSALADALKVPLVSLFRETTSDHSDYTFVKAGEGLKSTRLVNDHRHDFVNLALHPRRDLCFGARLVTLKKQDAQPPIYCGHGVVFIYAVSGKALYSYGNQEFEMEAGDSISIDAELRHGFVKVLTAEFAFLTVQAENRS